MKANAKEKIIQVAAEIIHQKGFHHSGIQEILKKAGVPKGSFYFHFKNKEDLGLQVIDHFMEFYFLMLQEATGKEPESPVRRLHFFFDTFSDYFITTGYKKGCPIGNLAQESGSLNDAFGKKLEQAFDTMQETIIGLLRSAKIKKEIPDSLDEAEMADFILMSWEGALMRMKVTRNNRPYEIFQKMVFTRLLV